MDIEIGSLPARSISEAGKLLARAFAADPVITHFLAGPLRRRLAFPALFRALLHEHVGFGHVYAAWEGRALVGVFICAPPGAPPPAPEALRRAEFNHRLVRLLFPRAARGLYGGFSAVAALHPQEPHWYAAFLGIDPNRQGRGIGARLFDTLFRSADAQGLPCYLETPFPATVKFYQRIGFKLRSEARPFQGAPPIWTMLRPPVSATGAARPSQ